MNELAIFLVLISAELVFLSCCVLVFHPDYHDGLLMRAGLVIIAFCAVSRIARLVDGTPDYLNPVAIALWVGLAMFMGGHLYRFLRRVTWKGPTWYPKNSIPKSFGINKKIQPPG